MFRRELEKAEHEVSRSSGIIADYKQVERDSMTAVGKGHVLHEGDILIKHVLLLRSALS